MLIIRKQPSEKFVQFVDFASLLGTSELAATTPIASGWVERAVLLAGDTGAETDVSYTALASTTGVNVTIAGGLPDNWYRVNVLASTAGGNAWEDELAIEVREG